MMDDVTLEKVLDFIQEHLKYVDREKLREYVRVHEGYGTFDYAVNEVGDIIGIVRWNMNGDVAEVLDMAVREGFRGRKIGNDFIKKALNRFPSMKKLRFKRGLRGDDRKKELSVDRILVKNIL